LRLLTLCRDGRTVTRLELELGFVLKSGVSIQINFFPTEKSLLPIKMGIRRHNQPPQTIHYCNSQVISLARYVFGLCRNTVMFVPSAVNQMQVNRVGVVHSLINGIYIRCPI